MKDLNFFSIYYKKNNTNKIIFFSVFLFCVVTMLSIFMYLHIEKNNIEKELSKIREFMAKEEVTSNKAKYQGLIEDKDALDRYQKAVTEILNNINARILFDSTTMDKINSKLPKNANLEIINYSENNINCEFNVPNLAVATELISGLYEVDCLENVKTGVVTKDGEDGTNYYTVSVTADVKGGE